MIVRAGYLVDGQPREDTAEGADYAAAVAALPDRGDSQRLWIKVDR